MGVRTAGKSDAPEARGFAAPDRMPPHNLEAEQSLLGSMLISENVIPDIVERLDPDAFYREAHREIFASIVALYARGEPADPITVAEDLEKRGVIEAVGGKPYIHTLVSAVPSAANAPYYARIVERDAALRSLIRAATEIAALGYEGPEDVDAAIDRAETLIFNVAHKRVSEKFVPMKELMEDSFELVEKLYEKKEHVTGIPSGFPDLDDMTAGFHPGDLIIIAARPTMGKTALALNVARNVGVRKVPVAVFSLEMSRVQLAQRMMCSEAEIDSSRLRTGRLRESEWEPLGKAVGRLAEATVYIDDTPNIGILEVRAKARRLFARQEVGLIIVDYLQLMQSGRRVENRQQEIAEISRGLKILAKELEVPVLAVSQLSRAVEQRGGDRKPVLSDLRESGALEQDSDVVLFIHRNIYSRADDFEFADDYKKERQETELILAKHRNGPVGVVKLTFIEQCARFQSWTRGDIV